MRGNSKLDFDLLGRGKMGIFTRWIWFPYPYRKPRRDQKIESSFAFSRAVIASIWELLDFMYRTFSPPSLSVPGTPL